MPESSAPRTPADPTGAAPSGTRAALLDAGLHFFGRKGFEATSTRELAERAGTNIASIAYHFGGKEGLHLACGAELVRRFQAEIGPLTLPQPPTPEIARAMLEQALCAFTGFLIGSHQADDMISFMLREVAENGPVLELIYTSLIEPKHRELCAIWSMVSGEPIESETLRLRVFAMLGQVVYFRIGRSIVGRRMGWDDFGPAQSAQVAEVLIANLHRLLTPEVPR